ncbi:MAG: hypothetical protein HOQ24_19195, partial [Mycobacteriaceae bacterium]|nr:hypothetical protein [Mycobacteriaceae bacterium]
MALSTSPDTATAEPTSDDQSPVADPSSRRSAVASRLGFWAGLVAVAATFAIGAWQRRWVADDGLIVLRTVRNLLAGNGPVFNIGERVETNTSAAWTFIVYFFARVTQARLEYIVLALAMVLSVAAIVLAMLGTARLRTAAAASSVPALLLPAGAVVYIALSPARDFATSGLESCLVVFWLGLLWWMLVRWSTAQAVRLPGLLALVFTAGLGWLVRPELVLVSGLVLLVVILSPAPLEGPGFLGSHAWAQRLALAAVAGALPVGYQIFRMGYYGLPYPNTAVAKEAAGSKWTQGFRYLWDTVDPYWLWLPVALLALCAVALRLGRED